MGRISELSDELLIKILSFLPTKEAVSTCILSKQWEFLWMWLPKLEYNTTRDTVSIRRDSVLRDFIDKNLPLHKAPIIECLRLLLRLGRLCHFKPEDIRLWVEIAVSRHVRELEVDCAFDDQNTLPSSLFTCKSLATMKLSDVFIQIDVPSMVCLPSLKTLVLRDVSFIDGKTIQLILSGCPVLEDLSVHLDTGYIKEFSIFVPSLQSLSLCTPYDYDWTFDGYEIDTPSLKYLKLEDWSQLEHYSLIKNMPKLREAYVNVGLSDTKSLIIGSITSVKRLTICLEDVHGNGFVFNQLEHLNICVCKQESSNLLGQLLKDSPKLRVLEISVMEGHGDNGMVCWNQPSHVPECLLSSLEIFKWSQYFGRPQDRDIAVYILKYARHLKTATFLANTAGRFVPNLKMLKELALSPRASTTCQLVFVEDLNHKLREVTNKRSKIMYSTNV